MGKPSYGFTPADREVEALEDKIKTLQETLEELIHNYKQNGYGSINRVILEKAENLLDQKES